MKNNSSYSNRYALLITELLMLSTSNHNYFPETLKSVTVSERKCNTTKQPEEVRIQTFMKQQVDVHTVDINTLTVVLRSII